MINNKKNTIQNKKFPPSNWEETTLGKVIFPVSETFNFKNIKKVHFLNTGDILNGKLLHNNLSDVSILPGQAKKVFKKNDILFSEIRPANKRHMFVNFDSSNSVASTKFMVLRGKEKIDMDFIYKFLTSKKTLQEFQIIAESRSGTFPQITFESISNFLISLPPPEQKVIASILSSFDDKIELLREENKTLEEAGQVIFKEWFGKYNVDKPEELPEGWRVGKLSEIAKIDWGNTSITKSSYSKNGEFLGVSAAGGDGRMDHKEYDYGTVVISAIGAYCGRIFFPKEDFTAIKNTLVVKQKNTNYSYFLYFGLNTWKLNQRGAAQPFLSKGDTESFGVCIPTEEILNKFEAFAHPIFEKIRKNSSQIQILSRSRDVLLPRLMRGEVRV